MPSDDFDDFEPSTADLDADGDDALTAARELVRKADEAASGPNLNRAQRRAQNIPAHAPKPQDRKPKKLAQKAEVEDVEMVITLFGEEFRVRRSALADDIDFFAAQALRDLPGMTAILLGRAGFSRFVAGIRREGLKPSEAMVQLWDLIGEASGVGDAGNS